MHDTDRTDNNEIFVLPNSNFFKIRVIRVQYFYDFNAFALRE